MSIPVSTLVNVLPGVVSAGGSALQTLGLFLTQDKAIATNGVTTFALASDVDNFFGANSAEASLANIYFNGFDNSTQKPAKIIFAQYNQSPVAAWLRGGNISGITLAQLQALGSGVITLTIDGVSRTSSTINLSGAASLSNAASLIQAGFASNAIQPVVTFDSQRGSFLIDSPTTGAGAGFTVGTTTSSTTVNVTATTIGTLHVGQYISDSTNSGGVPANTYIASFGTYSASTGTGTIVVSTAVTTVSGDAMTANSSSISAASGTLSIGLMLTTATGAITSQGQAAQTQASFMNNIVQNISTNWATFMTVFDPDATAYALGLQATGLNLQKLAFSAWTNTTSKRYAYSCWDQDVAAVISGNTTCLGYIVNSLNYNGTIPIYYDVNIAAFVCGAFASVDWNRTNGRITLAYKGQAGLVATVTNATIAQNLKDNGYNYYASYSENNNNFVNLQNGQISGVYSWADAYVNEIYLNSQIRLAVMNWLSQIPSVPFNQIGYNELAEVIKGPVNDALSFGAINTGIPLSSSQLAVINNLAGLDISNNLYTNGYYLQIKPATAQDRANRNLSTPILWYTDGGSIQTITLNSLLVQ